MGSPISPVVSGLLNAYSVGNLIKRQALGEREMKLREQAAQQHQAMQDLEMAVRLPQISRPVNSGMVDAPVDLTLNENAPDVLHTAQQIGMIPESTTFARKADRSRTIKHGEREYELMTPEEQAAQQDRIALRRETLFAGPRARNAAALKRAERLGVKSADQDARNAELSMRGVDVPLPTGGTIRVLPEELDKVNSFAHPADNRTPLQKEYEAAVKDGTFQGNILQFAQERNKRERIPVPGVDIPLPPDVAAQRMSMRPPVQPREERLVQVAGQDGTAVWVREGQAVGQPAAQAARSITGQERQALGFYNRMKQASDTFGEIEDVVAKTGIMAQGRLKFAPNWAQTDEGQAYNQARRSFTEARLRKESGAAIPPHEYAQDEITYFPQPGDSKATIDKKRAARETLMNSVANSAGKAYDEWYGEPLQKPAMSRSPGANAQPPAATGLQPGTIEGGYRFRGGDPSKRINWVKVD